MTSFFSIIIPLYNKEKHIKDTLNSVLNQTFKNFEVIIVNDGSTDDSLDKVNTFQDSRIQIYSIKNQGVSYARNYGIEKAKADYIVFLDADDLWFINHLEELKNLQQDFPNCGIYCNRYKIKISKNKTISNRYSYSIEDSFRGVIPDFFEASLVDRVALTSCVMVPKKVITNAGKFDTSISSCQDLDLWIKIAIENKVAITNQTTVIYRYDIPHSLSKTAFLSKKIINLDKFKIFEKQNKSLKKFIDIYRLEYAVQYRIAGSKILSNKLKDKIESKIPLKTSIILKSPPCILRLLLLLKHKLKSLGFTFSIYH